MGPHVSRAGLCIAGGDEAHRRTWRNGMITIVRSRRGIGSQGLRRASRGALMAFHATSNFPLNIMRLLIGNAVAICLTATSSPAQRLGPRDVDTLPSRAPQLRSAYGPDSLQFGELRLPSGSGP